MLSLVAYAGGLFLPFKDATSRDETYGGGRYLFDTVKNTDGLALEVRTGSTRVVARLQLRLQPVLRLQPALGVPAGAARERAPDPGPSRREELPAPIAVSKAPRYRMPPAQGYRRDSEQTSGRDLRVD